MLASGIFLFASGVQARQQSQPSPTEGLAIVNDAYVNGHSLLTSDVTRIQMSNMPGVEAMKAPLNQFINVKR
jgi:hypothetical protein